MRSKLKYIIIILLLILLTGCTKINDIIIEEENSVKEVIKNTDNITEDNIKDSYNYIVNNLNNINNKEVLKNIIYNNKYIELLTKDIEDNELYEFSLNVNNYIIKRTKDNKKKITSMIEEINCNLDLIVNNIYDNYYHNILVDKINSDIEDKVLGDVKDPKMVNKDSISKALKYINIHLDNIYENEETLEKTIYYSSFLYRLSKDTNTLIEEISSKTVEYVKSNNPNTYQIIKTDFKRIDDNKIEELISIIEGR